MSSDVHTNINAEIQRGTVDCLRELHPTRYINR